MSRALVPENRNALGIVLRRFRRMPCGCSLASVQISPSSYTLVRQKGHCANEEICYHLALNDHLLGGPMPDATYLPAILTATGVTFAACLAILGLSLGDKLPRPILTSFGIFLLFDCILGWIAYYYVGLLLVAEVLGISAFFLIVIVAILKRRDTKGIKMGQGFLEALHRIDLQTTYVLHLFSKTGATPALAKAINTALSFILTQVALILKVEVDKDQSHLSLLLAREGKFKVIAQTGVTPKHVAFIEKYFSYENGGNGLAGKSAARGQVIYIPDLSDESNLDVKSWIRVGEDEDKEGSIICYPMIRGVGEEDGHVPLAVLSVTSIRKKAFDPELVTNMFRLISPRIEELIYIGESIAGMWS